MTKIIEATSELNLEIGMPVDASDHHWGVVDDIVIDPTHWKVTHLVVQPRFRHHKSRLIPLGAIVACDNRVRLSLTKAEILAAPKVEITDFVRYDVNKSAKPHPGRSTSNALMWPNYPGIAGGGWLGYGYGYGYGWGAGYGLGAPAVATTTFDRVPSGTVEIRRDSEVITSDHHVVGHVDGFVTNSDRAITHLVLGSGHLWGHREISIPLADIAYAACDEVRLTVTRDDVEEYPPVPFERP